MGDTLGREWFEPGTWATEFTGNLGDTSNVKVAWLPMLLERNQFCERTRGFEPGTYNVSGK